MVDGTSSQCELQQCELHTLEEFEDSLGQYSLLVETIYWILSSG